jgi:hypothetical protein
VNSTTLDWINQGLIISGDSASSPLIKALTSGKPEAMKAVTISAADLAAIKTWIGQIKITCSLPNSKLNTAKIDGCGCNASYDETRNAGLLTKCLPHPEVICSINFSQVNASKADSCGCIPGYSEKRNQLQKLTECTVPIFAFDLELKRYNRCHGQFTRAAISIDDPRVPLIKTKKLTGTKACMELLKKANLTSTGKVKSNPAGDYDLEGMQVLSTFQKLHMSWFTNHNWGDSVANQAAFYRGTQDLFYSGEPALLMTNTLFNTAVSAIPYSSIVTSPNAYEAITFRIFFL